VVNGTDIFELLSATPPMYSHISHYSLNGGCVHRASIQVRTSQVRHKQNNCRKVMYGPDFSLNGGQSPKSRQVTRATERTELHGDRDSM